jgi:hypothetical protein
LLLYAPQVWPAGREENWTIDQYHIKTLDSSQGRYQTYSTSFAGTDVVWCSNFEAWVAHEDGRFDVVGSDATGTGQSLLGVSVAAQSIIEDLTSLPASGQ